MAGSPSKVPVSAEQDALRTSGKLKDLADVTSTAATNGQYLRFNGTTWEPHDPATVEAGVLADLTDVDATAPATGDTIVWDGDSYAPGLPVPSKAKAPAALPADGALANSQVAFALDESGGALLIKAKDSTGTVLTGSVDLT